MKLFNNINRESIQFRYPKIICSKNDFDLFYLFITRLEAFIINNNIKKYSFEDKFYNIKDLIFNFKEYINI